MQYVMMVFYFNKLFRCTITNHHYNILTLYYVFARTIEQKYTQHASLSLNILACLEMSLF